MERQDFVYSGNEITETITQATTIETREVKANDVEVVLTAEAYNEKAVLHYESIIRSSYKQGRKLIEDTDFAYRDTLISSRVTLDQEETFIASRGVAQFGRSSKAPEQKILTHMQVLRKYEGHELGIVFAKPDEYRDCDVAYQAPGDTRFFSIDSTLRGTFLPESEIIYFDLIDVDADGNIILFMEQDPTDVLPIKACKIPEHPFYVRWINDLGGYDYWMFACDHGIFKSLDTNELCERYGSRGAMTSYNREGSNKVEVTTGIIDRQTMEAIAGLIFSPDIRWYNEEIGQWVPINPDPVEISWKAEQPTGQLTFAFTLPKQQINK